MKLSITGAEKEQRAKHKAKGKARSVRATVAEQLKIENCKMKSAN
jgi:hypothetical protein